MITRGAAACLAALLLLAACGDDAGGDGQAFCAAVEDLRSDDPFAELAVASPGEMRDAFARLRDGAEEIASSAPGPVAVQADRYLAAIDALIDELAGAAYDPRLVDNARYAGATADYRAAAASVDNAARSIC